MTSTATGALTVAGGIGITGNIYASQFFYSNGTQAVGPQGPTGPQGMRGAAGDPGFNGAQGPTGPTGPTAV